MIILFGEEHKTHLQKLAQLKDEKCIRRGATKNTYKQIAEQFELGSLENVANIIEGMVFLFTEASKNYIPEIDFLDSIITLGYTENLKNELKEVYLNSRDEIRKIASSLSVELPKYKNLDWRLDVEIASRSLRSQVEPTYQLKLETLNSKGQIEAQFLQTDVVNMKHIVQELENALNESKSGYARRIMRNVK